MSERTSTAALAAPDAGTLLERADALATVNGWIREAVAQGEVEEGVIPEHLQELLDAAELPFREKVARTGRAVLRHEADARAIKDEITRLGERLARAQRRAEQVRAYARLCLELAGETKVETPLVTVAIQRNGGSPPIRWTRALGELPEAFRRMPAEPWSLDVAAAREYLRTAGRLPDGFEIGSTGSSLRVR